MTVPMLMIFLASVIPTAVWAGTLTVEPLPQGLSTAEPTTALRGHTPASPLTGRGDGIALTGRRHGGSLTVGSQGGGLAGRAQREWLIGSEEDAELIGRDDSGTPTEVDTPPLSPPVSTPALPPKPIPPEPQPTQYVMRNLQFDYDSAVLSETERPVIAELAGIIEHVDPGCVRLTGHTDRRGARSYNLDLSVRRAGAVRDALVAWHGLPVGLFEVVGRGEAELLSPGITKVDHARDRRVVVLLNCLSNITQHK